jgi:hypothetical protein
VNFAEIVEIRRTISSLYYGKQVMRAGNPIIYLLYLALARISQMANLSPPPIEPPQHLPNGSHKLERRMRDSTA